MGYKRLVIMEILEIIRRYFDKQNISQISDVTGYDRKTIRRYINSVTEHGINSYDKEKILKVIDEIKPLGRPKKTEGILDKYLDEISFLINNKENPLKAKSAYEVICQRHDLGGKASYSSYKRFIRKNKIVILKDKTTCRFESDPGEFLQIDYAKVGRIYDPKAGKNKTAYAFIGTLSFSRHKYVEFVYSQNQQSFVQSHLKMFSYFGGVPGIILLDNLKAGVIKPDLYNPIINRSYSEMAEHYGCFLNPLRVSKPKDKPIVERDVQTIREEFRKLKAINDKISLEEANQAILNWIKNHYGLRAHGTTKLKPYEEFIKKEKPSLLKLPIIDFETAVWKEARVHPDHYIQINKKSYSIPHQYVGEKVWVKVTNKLVSVYYKEKLVKSHTIPSGYRQTDLNDFPENMQNAMKAGMPKYLLGEAEKISGDFGYLIKKILSPHAYINMRKAQGLIRIAGKYPVDIINEASRIILDDYKSVNPRLFSSVVAELLSSEKEEQLPISNETSSYIRSSDYFIYDNK
jgi:transposase